MLSKAKGRVVTRDRLAAANMTLLFTADYLANMKRIDRLAKIFEAQYGSGGLEHLRAIMKVLSKHGRTPALAYEAVKSGKGEGGIAKEAFDVLFMHDPREDCSCDRCFNYFIAKLDELKASDPEEFARLVRP